MAKKTKMNPNKDNIKLKLGLFVVIGLLLFVTAIFIIGKQKNLFDSVFKLSTKFYNVSGLQVGNSIRFSGVNVGTVDNIQILNDSVVLVDLMVLQSIQKFIKVDSEISIGSEGIIGDRILMISQGSDASPSVKSGQLLVSNEPTETDEIIRSIEVTALNAEIISGEMASILTDINSGKGTLGRLIQDSSLATNLSKTMKNLESSSQGLSENMEAAKESVLLRGYFNRKERKERKKQEAAQKLKEESEKK